MRFTTVLVEVALFMEEREERKLLRELLRSTSFLFDFSGTAIVLRVEFALLIALLVKLLICAAAEELVEPCIN